MNQVFLTSSSAKTKKTARDLAKKILKARPKRVAFILGLVGELGGGKTTFLQGFAKGLGVKEKITSPTFVIMKRFLIPDHLVGGRFSNFYHFDCYRAGSGEILALGFKKIISDPRNIVAIEWASRVKSLLPKETIWLDFKFIDNKTRKIAIK